LQAEGVVAAQAVQSRTESTLQLQVFTAVAAARIQKATTYGKPGAADEVLAAVHAEGRCDIPGCGLATVH
jgi:hypothetical protein